MSTQTSVKYCKKKVCKSNKIVPKTNALSDSDIQDVDDFSSDSYDLTYILTHYVLPKSKPVKINYNPTKKPNSNETLKELLINKLSHPSLCNFSSVDSNGNSSLMIALTRKYFSIASKILEVKPDYDLTTVNSTGKTALILAITSNAKEVLHTILQNPQNCVINNIASNGNTALILACKKKLYVSALKLANCSDVAILTHVGPNLSTALSICCNSMDKVAKKIITRTNGDALTHINSNGETPFSLVCENERKHLCTEMLKYPTKCIMGNVDNAGYTALQYTTNPDMLSIAGRILDYPNECNMSNITEGETALNEIMELYSDYETDDSDDDEDDEGSYQRILSTCSVLLDKFFLHPTLCGLTNISDNNSIINKVCRLENPNKFIPKLISIQIDTGINMITKNTLHLACEYNVHALIDFIFSNPCHIYPDHIYNGTVLILLCEKKLEHHALQILSNPSQCMIDRISPRIGKNALVVACENKLYGVVEKILDYLMSQPNAFSEEVLGQVPPVTPASVTKGKKKSNKYNTLTNNDMYKRAFDIMCELNKVDIATKILQFIPSELNKKLDTYANDPFLIALSNMNLDNTSLNTISTKLNSINEYNTKYEQALSKNVSKSDCVVCFEDTATNVNHYCLTNCGHTISLCGDCLGPTVSNVCPLCRKHIGKSYVKAYVV